MSDNQRKVDEATQIPAALARAMIDAKSKQIERQQKEALRERNSNVERSNKTV